MRRLLIGITIRNHPSVTLLLDQPCCKWQTLAGLFTSAVVQRRRADTNPGRSKKLIRLSL